jgi:glycosyltransferase involved in cell wall biosynthesis
MPTDSLCVFSDQALGPWIPLFKSRPHIVHCHDLLALEAAMHQQSFHQLGRTGQLFQGWIRHGFRQARCFLSVSQATCAALERQLQRQPLMSAVLYNPLPSHFSPMPQSEVEVAMARDLPALGRQLFLLHIGRAWYKNRLGLLAVWEQLQILQSPVDLVLVGAADPAMREWISQRPELECRIHILDRACDSLLVVLYNQAAALLFPSHAEGFGWPILEALACGCPVVTTDAAPMTEVGGQAASYIPLCPPGCGTSPVGPGWLPSRCRRCFSALRPRRRRQCGMALVRPIAFNTNAGWINWKLTISAAWRSRREADVRFDR